MPSSPKLLDPIEATASFPWDLDWRTASEERRKQITDLGDNVQSYLQLPFRPHLKQMQLFLHPARGPEQVVLYGGGMRSGKSHSLSGRAVSLARRLPAPGRCFLGRFTLTAFRRTTLLTLDSMAREPEFHHHQTDHTFTHKRTGFVIEYGQLGREADVQNLGSSEFCWIGVDEAPEVPRKVISMLQTRLSATVGFEFNEMATWLTANPMPGWVKEEFVKRPPPNHHFIPALVTDNPHVPEQYIEAQRVALASTPELFKAWMEGDWDAFVPEMAALPPNLVRDALGRHEEPDPSDVVWGIDVGHLGNDDTAVWGRAGVVFRRIDKWLKERTDTSTDRIIGLYWSRWPKPHQMNVDIDGLGAGLWDQLMRAQEEGKLPKAPELNVIGVHAEGKPTEDSHIDNPLRYKNVKSENFMKLRGILESGRGDIEDDEMVFADLTTPLYDIANGLVVIEAKDSVSSSSRLGRSPNDGDAMLLTLYSGRQEYVAGRARQIQEQQMTPQQIEQMRAAKQRAETEQRFRNTLASLTGQPAGKQGRRRNLGY